MNPKTLELKEKITAILKDCCGCPLEHEIMDLIKQSNIALLERIGEEIVEEDEMNYNWAFTADVEARNKFRASQRLKLDEIKKSL